MNIRATALPVRLLLAFLLAWPLVAGAEAGRFDERIDRVLAGDQRDAANRARDAYRHPRETLRFFGLQPDQTVVEVAPGGGWYTEILAPYLRDSGSLSASAAIPVATTTAIDTDLGNGKAKSDHSLQLAHYWLILNDMGHAPAIHPIGATISSDKRVVWRLLDDGKNSFIAEAQAEWNERWAAIEAMRNGGTCEACQ